MISVAMAGRATSLLGEIDDIGSFLQKLYIRQQFIANTITLPSFLYSSGALIILIIMKTREYLYIAIY